MNIILSDSIPYTVSQSGAVMRLIYYPGVNLASGLMINITFV
jgi:hypothetical protein